MSSVSNRLIEVTCDMLGYQLIGRLNSLLRHAGYRLVECAEKAAPSDSARVYELVDLRSRPGNEATPVGPRTTLVRYHGATFVVTGPRPLVTEELPNEFDAVAWQLPPGFTVKSAG